MDKLVIKTFQKEDADIWNDLLKNSPSATIWHQSEWLNILEKHTAWENINLGGFLGEECIIAIPLFIKKNQFFTNICSPPPGGMIQSLGPVMPYYNTLKQNKKEYYFREFQREFDKYIKKKYKPISINIITSPGLEDVRPYVWNNYYITPKYNYSCKIDDLESLWNGFKKELRKNIKNAEKAGVKINNNSKKLDYDIIVDMVFNRLNDQELGHPTSKAYMNEVFENFYPDNIKVFTCVYKNEIISGIITIIYNKRVSIWVGATQCDISGIYPVDLCQWEIMKWAKENGYETIEIIGANMPQNSYFKSRYNLDLTIYFSVNRRRYNWSLIDIRNKLNEYRRFQG
jgi:hypothetical protein